MTINERATQWYSENASAFEHEPKEVHAVIVLTVGRAITAAVEAEREAIKTIVENALTRYSFGEANPTQAFLSVLEAIRARSEAK